MDKGDPDHDAVSAVDHQAKALEEKILQASKGAEAGETVAGGYQAKGTAKATGTATTGSKKDKENAFLNAMMNEANRLDNLLAPLYEQRQIIMDDLEEIKDRQDQLNGWHDQIAQGALPELDENGAIRDDELETLVAAYERRKGHSVDRSDPAILMALIAAEQKTQGAAHEAKLEALKKVQDQIDPLEERLEDLRDGREIDAAGMHDVDQKQEAIYSEVDAIQEVQPTNAPGADFDNFSF